MWVAVLLVVAALSLFSGKYMEAMSLAVLKSGPLPQGMSHDAMVLAFAVISLVVAFISAVAGFILVHFASKDKTWAKWLFLVFCLWELEESIWGVLQDLPNVSGSCFWDRGYRRRHYCVGLVVTAYDQNHSNVK